MSKNPPTATTAPAESPVAFSFDLLAASLTTGSVVLRGQRYTVRALSEAEVQKVADAFPLPRPPKPPAPLDDPDYRAEQRRWNARCSAAEVAVAIGLVPGKWTDPAWTPAVCEQAVLVLNSFAPNEIDAVRTAVRELTAPGRATETAEKN